MANLAIVVAGCEPNPPPVLEPLGQPGQLQAAPPRINTTIPVAAGPRAPFVSSGGRGGGVAVKGPQRALPTPHVEGGDVTLNFIDTDIREVARVILGTMLKLNYTIDPGVQGTATLETGTPVPRSSLLATLETVLNQNGATLVLQDGMYRVTSQATGVATANVGLSEIGSGSQIVPLQYASARELARLLEPYVVEGGKITADPTRNALIVGGNPTTRQTLTGLIRSFDIDMLAGQSYALFPAGDENPARLSAQVEKLLRADGEGPLAGVVRVMPMPRANAVLVVSSQPRYIEDARRFLGLTKRVEDATARSWHVYYVQNGQSADLENLLQRAFTPNRVGGGGGPVTPPSGAESLRSASSRLGGGGTGLGGLGGAPPPPPGVPPPGPLPGGPAGAAATARDAADILTGQVEGGGEGGETEKGIRIIANRRNNALLIYATPSEYSVIEGMLRKIDIIPLQVLIEATIAEVTLNDKLNYGTQFYLGHTVAGMLSFNGDGSNAFTTVGGVPAGFANNLPGFVVANGVREVINALSSITQVRVLSAPQVMVLDNEPARLQVGALVPVLTQSQQGTISPNAPIVNSIDYRDTGVIMVVTPRVNSGGLVSLDISQEVSDVASLSTGEINSPTFNQRLIRTRVAVQDGQTVGMAGLIRDADSQGNAGIPVLKDIPLLGTLVSNQQNSRARTELLVLITPRVVHDQRDARLLTEDLRKQLINAGMVRQELNRKPPSGSANPNRF